MPQGYVRLLVFDADSNYVASQTAQLTQAASSGYQNLSVQVIAPTDGYVTAYVGNESDADVYFDDVRLEHRQGLQVQETHYDPVGLELAGLAPHSPGLKPLNQYKFNGKEFQADLGLNWNHHDWRFFDPQLGRWHTVDPLSDAGQEMWSPYAFGFNNALRFSDPDGRVPGPGELLDRTGDLLKRVKESIAVRAAVFMGAGVAEQRFAQKHTATAVLARNNAKESARTAESANLGDNRDGGRTNALRHAYGYAVGSKELGPQTTRKLANIHEGPNSNALEKYQKNVQELMQRGQTVLSTKGNLPDSFVDQLNNAAGERLFAENPGATKGQLATAALTDLLKGKLYMYTLNEGGHTATVTPTTLSQGQYEQALQHINAYPRPEPKN